MNKNAVSIALVVLLSTQNLAYAQSRTEGIGKKPVQQAKSKLQQISDNLSGLESDLAKFENILENFETTPNAKSELGMQAGLVSILGSATALLGFAMKQPNQGAGFTVIAGIVVQIAAGATALFTHGSDYFQSTGSFADLSSGGLFEMIKKLDSNVQALIPLIKNSDSEKVFKLQKASSDLRFALQELNHDHKDSSVKKFSLIVAEASSILLSIANANTRSLAYSTGLGKGLLGLSATVQSAGMYIFTRELDRSELLTAIRSTRKDISSTLASLRLPPEQQ